MEKFYSLWKDFVSSVEHKNKPSQLQENLEILNEISRDVSDKIYKWMRDASVMDYSFDELFDGKMRMAMPFDSEDALNLKKVVRTLKKNGWGVSDSSGMEIDASVRSFATKKVKQKRQRLADQGGGFYEEEIVVADLELSRSYEKEIPAGPRKGEVIQRIDKLGMGKAIAKLVKEKKLDKDLLDWWHKKQTYYTKDNNWKEIEGLFSGDEVDYTVIISRHPVDVLRMSDIGSIRSCHSEGHSHFQCAVAEAKGHGPIAYLVPTTEYDKLMAGLYEEYDTADDPESAYDVNRSTSKLLEAHAVFKAEEYIKNHITTIHSRWSSIYKIIDNIKTSKDEDMLEFAIQAVFDADPVYGELDPAVRGLLTDQAVMDAVVAKAEGKEWSLRPDDTQEDEPDEPEEIGDISKFDDKEIFRDGQRGVKGIVAKGRVRFRKFEDSDTDMQFIAPEHRTYGAVPPGFVKSMVKWAAESQKEAFKEAGFLVDFRGEYSLAAPNWYSLTRYGGSYEDTKDGDVLTALFQHYDPEFSSYTGGWNVDQDSTEEDANLFEEYDQRVDELNDYAANNLGHCSTHAEVNDDGEEPYVYASGDLSIELNLLGWNGIMEDYTNSYTSRGADEDGTPYTIPKSWGGDYQKRRQFERVIEDKLDIYSEETDWEVNVQKGGAIGEKGPTTVLEVRFRFSMEDGHTPDDYENFIDYLKSDVDDKVPNIRETIRSALVEEGYMERNYFDKFNYAATEDDEGEEIEPGPTPAEEFAESLQHFDFYPPSDDGDGEMLFVTRSPGVGRSSINYIPTSTLMPASLRKHDRATGWTVADLETAFGGERYSLGFGTPPSVKHTGLGMHKIAMALSDIQKEAEAHAGKQLSLDFGERYEAPPDQDVLPDFAKNVEFITVLATPTASEQAGLPETGDKDSRHLGFAIRVRILSVDSEREIKGAIAFMEYVDREIRTIARAFQSLWEPAIEEAVETKEKAEAAAVSKGTMEKLTNALDTKVRNMLNNRRLLNNVHYQPPLVAVLKAYIEWAHAAWPEMNLLERRTLINQYLRPLQQGSLGTSAGNFEPNSSGSSHSPLHWHRAVKQSHREAGAPEAVWGRYGWVGPDFREILQKHQAEAGIDRDAELDADIEQAERVEQELSPERQAWADALDQQDAEDYAQRVPVPEEPEDLRESLRRAIKESLYSQGGPEDLPSMGPGHAKRDCDEEDGVDDLEEAIRNAINKTIYKERGTEKMNLKEVLRRTIREKLKSNKRAVLKESPPTPSTLPSAEDLLSIYTDEPRVYDDDYEDYVVGSFADEGYEDPSLPPVEWDPDPFDDVDIVGPDGEVRMRPEDIGTFADDRNPLDSPFTPRAEAAYLRWRDLYGDTDHLAAPGAGADAALMRYDAIGEYLSSVDPMQLVRDGNWDEFDYYTQMEDEYANFDLTAAIDAASNRYIAQPRNVVHPTVQEPYAADLGDARINSMPGFRGPVTRTGGYTSPARPHYGLDVGWDKRPGQGTARASTTAQTAPLAGRVVFAGRAGNYGNQIQVQSIDPNTGLPIVWTMSHLPRNVASQFPPGSFVDAGEFIANMGQTGSSFGVHQHFEMHGLPSGDTDIASIPAIGAMAGEHTGEYVRSFAEEGDDFFPSDAEWASMQDVGNPRWIDVWIDANGRYVPESDAINMILAHEMENHRTGQSRPFTALTRQRAPNPNPSEYWNKGWSVQAGHMNPYEYFLETFDPREHALRSRMAAAAMEALDLEGRQANSRIDFRMNLSDPAVREWLIAQGYRPDFDEGDLMSMIDWQNRQEALRQAQLSFDPGSYSWEDLAQVATPYDIGIPRARRVDPNHTYGSDVANIYNPHAEDYRGMDAQSGQNTLDSTVPAPDPTTNPNAFPNLGLQEAIREAINITIGKTDPNAEKESDCELPTIVVEGEYVQEVHEVIAEINIHKQKGGNRDQTLTDIRGIDGVTIVSVVPGTSRELPHTFITTLSVKFRQNKALPPKKYVKETLLPSLQKIPGVSHFRVKSIRRIGEEKV